MSTEFERWLETELDKSFSAVSSRPLSAEPRYQTGITARRKPMFTTVSTLARSKALVSILGAALLIGGGTAAAAAATGSSPVVLAREVPAAAVTCGRQLTTGQHGLGSCVSNWVQAHHDDASGATRAASDSNATASPSDSNHGAAVSAVAHSAAPGESHGDAVSAVARSEEQAATSSSEAAFGQSVASTARSNATAGEAHGDAVSGLASASNPGATASSASASPSHQGRLGGAEGEAHGAPHR